MSNPGRPTPPNHKSAAAQVKPLPAPTGDPLRPTPSAPKKAGNLCAGLQMIIKYSAYPDVSVKDGKIVIAGAKDVLAKIKPAEKDALMKLGFNLDAPAEAATCFLW